MLDLKLPWKKVKVGAPIDTLNWQLSETVRGLHCAVDKEGDMIAMPVFIIDPTSPTRQNIVPQLPGGEAWSTTVELAASGNVFTANRPYRVLGALFSFAGPTLAVAADMVVALNDMTQTFWAFNRWYPVAAADLTPVSFYWPNGYRVPRVPGSISTYAVQMTIGRVLTSGAIDVCLWGLYED